MKERLISSLVIGYEKMEDGRRTMCSTRTAPEYGGGEDSKEDGTDGRVIVCAE